MRYHRALFGLIILSLLLFAGGVVAHMAGQAAVHPTLSVSGLTMHIGSTTLMVEVVDTPELRQRGLSGRASLSAQSGMLFVFPTAGRWGFWMKDMNFPLDLIWGDASGAVIAVTADVSPATYTRTPPEVFYPPAPARYVLEVNAGFAAAHGIQKGMQMVF